VIPRNRIVITAALTLGCCSLLGCAVMAFVVLLARPAPEGSHAPWLVPSEEMAQFVPDTGVGQEALSSVQDLPRAVMPLVLPVGVPMPKKPFDGQRKPPCDPDTEIAVMGACWAVLKKEAPCGPKAFDYEGRCLRASFDAPRQPTSDPP
jgi:eukaryotic-like serine/threonine-protein kinase